eukprot:TRINITY_DN26175_c0_g1_i2.p1 TRINITY_DN26175_c0_g1~~TRINITY_DN26175_c0_g1_i2.p1  ORF type:complete len:1182 (-),score=245.43 TRINITY_DN26175_c0_g1_i2:48-3593(-)
MPGYGRAVQGILTKVPSPPPARPASQGDKSVSPRKRHLQGQQSFAQDTVQQVKALAVHLERLWDHFEIPSWHRELYYARYCSGSYHPEVLLKEAKAFTTGTAQVQITRDAISVREHVLERLKLLRWSHTDADFNTPRSRVRKHLWEQMGELRMATIAVVEALVEWRRLVAPIAGQPPPPPVEGQWTGTRTETADSPRSGAFVSATATACWPFQFETAFGDSETVDDYLLHVIQGDQVAKDWSSVIKISEESDPFLLNCSVGGAGPNDTGKLCFPTPDSNDLVRLEAARLKLLEEEISFAVLRPSRPGSPGSSPCVHRKTPLVHSLTVPLELPPLKPVTFRSASHGSCGGQQRRKPRVPTLTRRKLRSAVTSPGSLEVDSPFGSDPETDSLGQELSVRKSSKHRLSQFDDDSSAASSTNSRKSATPLNRQPPEKERRSLLGETLAVCKGLNAMIPNEVISDFKNVSCPDPRGPGKEDENADAEKDDGLAKAPKKPGGADPAKVASAWKRFECDMMVHHDDMSAALCRIGFVDPNSQWLEDSFVQVTLFNGVSYDEFVAVIDNYDARQRKAYAETFAKYDSDGTGELDIEEFETLLKKLDISPMKHVIKECMKEADEDGTGTMNFNEFYTVMKTLCERQFFTRGEYSNFKTVFDRFDVHQTLEIDAKELYQILTYLGSSTTMEETQAVAREVDLDGSGSIDFQEFILCMQKLRDREVDNINKQLKLIAPNSEGSITKGQLPRLLNASGYFADEDVVDEILTTMQEDVPDLDLEEIGVSALWQFLVIFRQNEGLSKADATFVREAFNHYAASRTCKDGEQEELEVSTSDLPKILRYIGYSMCLEEQKQLTAQVDIDRSGALSQPELLKLIRLCREQRFRKIQETFMEADKKQDGWISAVAALDGLRQLGCVKGDCRFPPMLMTVELQPKKELTSESDSPPDSDDETETDAKASEDDALVIQLTGFMRAARRLDEQSRRTYRESGGYSSSQLKFLKERFNHYDGDGSGAVDNHELMRLVTDVFPGMATDPRQRPLLLEIIKEADQDGSGTLDFEDFLRLMRAVEDLSHTAQLDKERLAVQMSRFSGQEVSEFRDIFLGKTEGVGFLQFEAFREMMEPICPLGDANLMLLQEIWLEVLLKNPKDPRYEEPAADFPDFLLLTHRLLETNFGGVVDRTKKYAPSHPSL